jgi:hypothetical protein
MEYVDKVENATTMESKNSMMIKVVKISTDRYLDIRLPTPIENNITDTIMVHCTTESPRKYVARVASMYSVTMPEKPVAKRASFKMFAFFMKQ